MSRISNYQYTNVINNDYAFSAKEYDEETGMYYMSARYMNPTTSRWASSAPLSWALINPNRDGFSIVESMNPYSYCSNNPIRFIDPTVLAAGDSFDNEVEAAADFTETYNDDSIRNDKEYSSTIYKELKDDEEVFSYTEPNVGEKDEVTPNAEIPENSIPSTTIHSHGKYDKSKDKSNDGDGPLNQDFNNVPSEQDRSNFGGEGQPAGGFLVTTNGSLKFYEANPHKPATDLTDAIKNVYDVVIPSDPKDPTRTNTKDPYSGTTDRTNN